MMAATGTEESRLTDDDLLDMITSAGLEPRAVPGRVQAQEPFRVRDPPVVTAVPAQRRAGEHHREGLPQVVMDGIEKAIAYAPPFTYSHITGVKSPTGDEAEGWLITVGGTPKQLMAHDPEFTYSRLLHAADIARSSARRSWVWGVHEGRRRCGRDGCQAGTAADHHGQQLQRLGCTVGPARRHPQTRNRRCR